MHVHDPMRRAFLGATASATALLATGQPLRAATGIPASDAMTFEVTRTEQEWRAMLSELEYHLLRETGTEEPRSSPHWDSTEPGHYRCKGCNLTIYEATWKIVLDPGWLFFRHALPNAVLTDLDQPIYEQFGDGATAAESRALVSDEERATLDELTGIEVHCRRCGSHFGHVLNVQEHLVHCVNGGCLTFAAQPA